MDPRQLPSVQGADQTTPVTPTYQRPMPPQRYTTPPITPQQTEDGNPMGTPNSMGIAQPPIQWPYYAPRPPNFIPSGIPHPMVAPQFPSGVVFNASNQMGYDPFYQQGFDRRPPKLNEFVDPNNPYQKSQMSMSGPIPRAAVPSYMEERIHFPRSPSHDSFFMPRSAVTPVHQSTQIYSSSSFEETSSQADSAKSGN